MSDRSVFFDVLSPVKFLPRSAAIFPDKTAVIHGPNRFSYAQFASRVYRLGSALKKAGVVKGDKVAFLCPNIPPMLEAHNAVPMIGAALVSINTRLSPQEIGYIINHSDAKVLFVDTELAPQVLPVISELRNVRLMVNICDIDDSLPLKGPTYEEFLATGSDEPLAIEVDDEYQVATINYTSGTTGKPKGVMYHHRGAFLNALGELIEAKLSTASVYLWTLPMFHCNGWCFTWAVTAAAGTHVCLRKVMPDEIFGLIESEGVTNLCAAPTVLVSMANFPGAAKVQMTAPLEIMTAGAPPAPAVIKNMEKLGANVTQTYGLTEVFGPHSICAWQTKWDNLPPDERAAIKARQGVPYTTALYMDVVDQLSMAPVPHDGATIGEIVMRGNNVMLGYYKDPEASAEAFRGGWFHSGDLAVVHPDGYVQIMDRSKDIIISGGENISTVEVENIIYGHPEVMEVAVIAVPDEKWGEVPKAYVTLKPEAKVTAEEIVEFCRQRLARFKAPKHVEFGPLPKTATGKIQKFKLREEAWKGREKKVQ